MDDLRFPDDPWSVDLTPSEWAALVLLREPDLLSVRDGESPADFYDPVTRSLAPSGDPVFDSKVASLRDRRTANVETILQSLGLEDYYSRRVPESFEVDPSYDEYAGEQEYAFHVALARWRVEEIQLHRLSQQARSGSASELDEELDRQSTDVQVARHEAELAWLDFRRKLDIYVNRIRLASLMIKRRNETGLSQEKFAAAAGVATSTVKNFENVDEPGRWFSPKTVGLMEAGLGWQAGSIAAVMAGGEPTEIAPAVSAGSSPAIAATKTDDGSRTLKVSVDGDVADVLRSLAIAEDRTISAVVADAVAFYAKYHLEEGS